MTAIYNSRKAQEVSLEQKADEEQRQELETGARRAREKEAKRVQVY